MFPAVYDSLAEGLCLIFMTFATLITCKSSRGQVHSYPSVFRINLPVLSACSPPLSLSFFPFISVSASLYLSLCFPLLFLSLSPCLYLSLFVSIFLPFSNSLFAFSSVHTFTTCLSIIASMAFMSTEAF